MITAASKYAPARSGGPCHPAPASRAAVPGSGLAPGAAAFNILVQRKARELGPNSFQAWLHREMKSGGALHEMMRVEKARTAERYRAVARKVHPFQQNNKSELRRVADIPARDYFRWLKEDPDFFSDNKNLKSLKRDNPDVKVYL